jgi:hypothetical protein
MMFYLIGKGKSVGRDGGDHVAGDYYRASPRRASRCSVGTVAMAIM